MNEFINHTNHPSARWEEAQRCAAEAYGVIADIPFPQIPADWDEDAVRRLAEENAREILRRFSYRASSPTPMRSSIC